MQRNRRLLGDHDRGASGHGYLHQVGDECRLDGHRNGDGNRNGDEHSRRDCLPADLRGKFCQRASGRADRDCGGRFHVRGLDRRGMQWNSRMLGHVDGSHDRDGHVQQEHDKFHVDRDRSGKRHRHGDERADRNCMSADVLSKFCERASGCVDGDGG